MIKICHRARSAREKNGVFLLCYKGEYNKNDQNSNEKSDRIKNWDRKILRFVV